MSKNKTRTISELLKGRPKGRQFLNGFDLLGEGDRIVAEMEENSDLLKEVKLPNPPPSFVEEFSVGVYSGEQAIISENAKNNTYLNSNDFSEDHLSMESPAWAELVAIVEAHKTEKTDVAIASSAIAGKAIESNAIGSIAIADDTIAKFSRAKKLNDVAGPAIVSDAIGLSAIVGDAIAKLGKAKKLNDVGCPAVAINAIARKVIVGTAIDTSAIVDDAIAKPGKAKKLNDVVGPAVAINAIARKAMVGTAIDTSAIVNDAIAKPGKARMLNDVVGSAIASDAIDLSAIAARVKVEVPGDAAGVAIAKEGIDVTRESDNNWKSDFVPTLNGLATREAYQRSHDEIERLKSQETVTLVDNYIFDTLFKELGDSNEAMVYLYLWRRTKGSGQNKVELSYQILSEAIGISKRAGQDVLKRLNEKKLLNINRESKTGIPSYEVLQPWNQK